MSPTSSSAGFLWLYARDVPPLGAARVRSRAPILDVRQGEASDAGDRRGATWRRSCEGASATRIRAIASRRCTPSSVTWRVRVCAAARVKIDISVTRSACTRSRAAPPPPSRSYHARAAGSSSSSWYAAVRSIARARSRRRRRRRNWGGRRPHRRVPTPSSSQWRRPARTAARSSSIAYFFLILPCAIHIAKAPTSWFDHLSTVEKCGTAIT